MTALSLAQKKCQACAEGTQPYSSGEEKHWLSQTPGWDVDRQDIHVLWRDFRFKDFKTALRFVNSVGEIAETEGHHPEIQLHNYSKVKIDLYTHKIKGLSDSDFIMAAKISELYQNEFSPQPPARAYA